MGKTVLITGIAGQDGRHLAEYLHQTGEYDHIVGMVHTQRPEEMERLKREFPFLEFVKGDLGDLHSLNQVIRSLRPDEVYNLGALSHVGDSFDKPEAYANVTGLGPARLLIAIREHSPETRFYQASSSEMFGKVRETPQTELTPFHPRSPYGIAKVHAHGYTVLYREAYDMHTNSGILFNHEGPRRGTEFVTRKATLAAARIALGMQEKVEFGNLLAKRDWGYAGDYVRAMYLMLQQPRPDDFVIATGETHTGLEFVERAFEAAEVPITWEFEKKGQGDHRDQELRRIGVNKDKGVVVRINPQYFRPAEVDLLIGDATKARTQLGWNPEITFTELVEMMVEHDLREQQKVVV